MSEMEGWERVKRSALRAVTLRCILVTVPNRDALRNEEAVERRQGR